MRNKSIILVVIALIIVIAGFFIGQSMHHETEVVPAEITATPQTQEATPQVQQETPQPTAAVQTKENKDLLPTMTEDERYALNIFLSNFSEIGFGNYDATKINRDHIMYFGCLHNSRNHTAGAIHISDEEAAKYITLNDFVHACYKVDKETVAESIDRYLGLEIEHGNALYIDHIYDDYALEWKFAYSNGYYYFDSGEEGDAYRRFTIADAVYYNNDGTYTVEFTDYGSGYMEVLDKCYNYTPFSIAKEEKATKEDSGIAVVRPHKYNGKDTYQLISMKY